jgi:uncharacterized membrane protein
MTDLGPLPGETEDKRDIRLNKDIAAFSYVWVMSVIIYFSRRDSKFIQYHAKQGIVLFLLTIPTVFIPYLGRFLLLVLVGGMLLGFVNAAQGRYEDVPVVGDLAKGNVSFHDIAKTLSALFQKLATLFRHSVRKPGSGGTQPSGTAPTPPSTETHPTPPVDTPPPPPVL